MTSNFKVVQKLTVQFKDAKGNFGPSYWLVLEGLADIPESKWTSFGAETLRVSVTKEVYDQTTKGSIFQAAFTKTYAGPPEEPEVATDSLQAARERMS